MNEPHELRIGDGIVVLLARIAPDLLDIVETTLKDQVKRFLAVSDDDIISFRSLGPYESIILVRTTAFDMLDRLEHIPGLKKLEIILCYEYLSPTDSAITLFTALQSTTSCMLLHLLFAQVEGHLILQYGKYVEQAVAKVLKSPDLVSQACAETSQHFVLGTLGSNDFVLVSLTAHCNNLSQIIPSRIKSLSLNDLSRVAPIDYDVMTTLYGTPKFGHKSQTLFCRATSLVGIPNSALEPDCKHDFGTLSLLRLKLRVKQGKIPGVIESLRSAFEGTAVIVTECGPDDLSVVFNADITMASSVHAHGSLRNAWLAIESVRGSLYEVSVRLAFPVDESQDIEGDLIDLSGLQSHLPQRFLSLIDRLEEGHVLASTMRNIYRSVNRGVTNHTIYLFFLDLALHLRSLSAHLERKCDEKVMHSPDATMAITWASEDLLSRELDLLTDAVTQRFMGNYELMNEAPTLAFQCYGGVQKAILGMWGLYTFALKLAGVQEHSFGTWVLGKTYRIRSLEPAAIITVPQIKLLNIESALWPIGHEIAESLLMQMPLLLEEIQDATKQDLCVRNSQVVDEKMMQLVSGMTDFAREVFCDAFALGMFLNDDYRSFLGSLLDELILIPCENTDIGAELVARAWVLYLWFTALNSLREKGTEHLFIEDPVDELCRTEPTRCEQLWEDFIAYVEGAFGSKESTKIDGFRRYARGYLNYPGLLNVTLGIAFRLHPSNSDICSDGSDPHPILAVLHSLQQLCDHDGLGLSDADRFSIRMELLRELYHYATRHAWDIFLDFNDSGEAAQ